MKGGSLHKLIRKFRKAKKPMKEATMRIVTKGILKALKYLHENNIVHRDVKPANLLFSIKDVFSSVKLADFGLSVSTGIVNLMPLYTRCGTRDYMAPEMFQKDRHYTRVIIHLLPEFPFFASQIPISLYKQKKILIFF